MIRLPLASSSSVLRELLASDSWRRAGLAAHSLGDAAAYSILLGLPPAPSPCAASAVPQLLAGGSRHSAAAGPLQSSRHLRFQHAQAEEAPAAAPAEGPLALYEEGLAKGLFRRDPRQETTTAMLQHLYEAIKTVTSQRRRSNLTLVDSVGTRERGGGGTSTKSTSSRSRPSSSSWWSSLLADGASSSPSVAEPQDELTGPRAKGLYMHGGVGCGKTMLMDLFVRAAPASFRVQRTHFHDFMLHVHSELAKHKGHPDPLVKVADDIAAQTKVLALDEFFVTDVADAMILSRLFGRLWADGLVLVATSNRAPDALYEGGLQRTLFLPFIAKLKSQCVVHDMASATDYRKLAQHRRGLYFVSPARDGELYEAFVEQAHGGGIQSATVEVMMGRRLEVPAAAGRACLFDFGELCGKPVAAADYIALCSAYHTLALKGVPVFGASNRTEAYRFVTLIDVMYEHRMRLLCSADAMPSELFERILTPDEARAQPKLAESADVAVDANLGFAKDRTISRLTEMQSIEYLIAHAQQHAPELLLALQEAKERGQR